MKQLFAVNDLLRDLQRLMGDRGRGIEFTCTPVDLKLYADRSQIEHVVLNILCNAVEATDGVSGARISVNAYSRDGKVVITVSDNGPGIEPETLDKIFVPFYTTRQTGSGIGLSISRQIMGRHEGAITVESQPGEGAVFSLTFP